ncbi:TPA: GNAT family N-acetyltransferase [Clostridioides difficile]|nr:GNAT family N-acetyltransferase [Clostridioides difficile]EQG76543.1 putative acetyltransferase [Clostridioides difficile DA00165]MCP8411827.1 GNAT family N-acetyltransferase [Clostridioides difficile]MDC2928377.1 GNAT family N-acetyltransferase [Clostridioides difficile]MDC9388936.1 GNAT family N-acetyltransferase [Clostridioides difficile]MDE3610998.1 GNAT family N-acetyltransferase [Clostridioides difficile]
MTTGIQYCICNKFNLTEITVNSSPYAVEVYHKLGFKDTAVEQIVDGIRFTPMKLLI